MAKTPAKTLVFVSHVAEEKEIACGLQEFVEGQFHGSVEVFVSSSPKSNPPGREWLNKITTLLKTCAIEIAIVGPHSQHRPWLNFEAGAVWSRGKPVIPLCHSGLNGDNLIYPLKILQAAEATNEESLTTVLQAIAVEVGWSTLPQINFAPFIARVNQFETDSHGIQKMEQASPIARIDGLTPHDLAILVAIAENGPHDGVAIGQLKEMGEGIGLMGIASHLAAKALQRNGMVEIKEINEWNTSYLAYCVTDEGWTWLLSHQGSLQLECNPAPPKGTQSVPQTDDIPF